jgi:GNAT superfamily N-acetyltransferase
MSFEIRRATETDAEVLQRLGTTTFTETFGHLYPPEDIEVFLAEAYGLERTRRDLAHPEKATWLLEDDGRAVGYALVGPCDLPHAEVQPSDGEVKRLYLLASHRGGGRGTRLLETALSWLEARGPRTLWIGVWSENLGAQRLYARHGFLLAGEYEFPVGQTRDRELILRRPKRP